MAFDADTISRALHILFALIWAGTAVSTHAYLAAFEKSGNFAGMKALMSGTSSRIHVFAGFLVLAFGCWKLFAVDDIGLTYPGGQFHVLTTAMTAGTIAWVIHLFLYKSMHPKMIQEGLEGHALLSKRLLFERIALTSLLLAMLGMVSFRFF